MSICSVRSTGLGTEIQRDEAVQRPGRFLITTWSSECQEREPGDPLGRPGGGPHLQGKAKFWGWRAKWQRKKESRMWEGRECEGTRGDPWSLGKGGVQEKPWWRGHVSPTPQLCRDSGTLSNQEWSLPSRILVAQGLEWKLHRHCCRKSMAFKLLH